MDVVVVDCMRMVDSWPEEEDAKNGDVCKKCSSVEALRGEEASNCWAKEPNGGSSVKLGAEMGLSANFELSDSSLGLNDGGEGAGGRGGGEGGGGGGSGRDSGSGKGKLLVSS